MNRNNYSGNLPPKSDKPQKEIIVNRIFSATLEGLSAKPIEVEATFNKGLPGFAVVGLVSSDIQEAKERVKSSLLTNEFQFPPRKITINLSPSDIRKSGTHFDLSIALLIALHKENISQDNLFVFGELGLDGRVKSSSTLFPIILSLKEQGLLQKAIVPKEAMEYLNHIAGIDFIPVQRLSDAIKLLQTKEYISNTQKFSYKSKKMVINGQT
ncbi:MAG: ATP-binding protein, partial [Sulfurovaceae bacterium]|nr:ATP-binding protein [Sulfurovaceae bacterium]